MKDEIMGKNTHTRIFFWFLVFVYIPKQQQAGLRRLSLCLKKKQHKNNNTQVI